MKEWSAAFPAPLLPNASRWRWRLSYFCGRVGCDVAGVVSIWSKGGKHERDRGRAGRSQRPPSSSLPSIPPTVTHHATPPPPLIPVHGEHANRTNDNFVTSIPRRHLYPWHGTDLLRRRQDSPARTHGSPAPSKEYKPVSVSEMNMAMGELDSQSPAHRSRSSLPWSKGRTKIGSRSPDRVDAGT